MSLNPTAALAMVAGVLVRANLPSARAAVIIKFALPRLDTINTAAVEAGYSVDSDGFVEPVQTLIREFAKIVWVDEESSRDDFCKECILPLLNTAEQICEDIGLTEDFDPVQLFQDCCKALHKLGAMDDDELERPLDAGKNFGK